MKYILLIALILGLNPLFGNSSKNIVLNQKAKKLLLKVSKEKLSYGKNNEIKVKIDLLNNMIVVGKKKYNVVVSNYTKESYGEIFKGHLSSDKKVTWEVDIQSGKIFAKFPNSEFAQSMYRNSL